MPSKKRNRPSANSSASSPEPKTVTITQQHFEGPIPPPAILENYNLILRDGAERIMAMAESQHNHRIAQEAAINQANINAQSRIELRLARGQWMAFLIALTGMGSSGAFVAFGHPIVGTIFGGTTIVSLAAAFLVDRKQPK